ncbi:hypothetical protein ACLOJK_034456 [Asimina triloba]
MSNVSPTWPLRSSRARISFRINGHFLSAFSLRVTREQALAYISISKLPFSSRRSNPFPTCSSHSCDGASTGNLQSLPPFLSSGNRGSRYTGVVDRFGFTDSADIMGDRPDMASIEPAQ